MKRVLLAVPLVLVFAVAVQAQVRNTSFLGVSISDDEQQGVSVGCVDDDSPAAEAGIEVGDVITEFNGLPVIGVMQFTRLVRETPVGRTVNVKVLRSGQERTLTLTTAERQRGDRDFRFVIPDDLPDLSGLGDRIRDAIPRVHVISSVPRLGIRVDSMTDQLREFFGVDQDEGVLVAEVEEDSAAADASLRAGDVIIEFDGRNVDSPGDLTRRSLRNHDTVTVTVVRDKACQDLTIDVPASSRQ